MLGDLGKLTAWHRIHAKSIFGNIISGPTLEHLNKGENNRLIILRKIYWPLLTKPGDRLGRKIN